MSKTREWVAEHLGRFWRLGVTYVAERAVFFSALIIPAMAGISDVNLGRLELYLTAGALAHAIGPLGTDSAMMHQKYSNEVGYWRSSVVIALIGGAVVGMLATVRLDFHAAEIGALLGLSMAVMHVSRNRLRVAITPGPLFRSTRLLLIPFALAVLGSLVWPEAAVDFIAFGLVLGTLLSCLPARKVVRSESRATPVRIRTLLAFGLPLSIAGAFEEIVVASDRYVINYIMGVEAVGHYGVAYRVVMLLGGVASTFVYWWEGEALRSSSGWARSELGSFHRTASTLVTVACLLAWWPLTFFLTRTLVLPFEEVGALTAWLLLSVIGFVVLAGYISAMIAEERGKLVGFVMGFNALLNIGLNLALIPHFGLIGAAFATACSQVCAAAFGAIVFHRLVPRVRTTTAHDSGPELPL